MAGGRFVIGGLAIVAGAKVGAAFRVFVLRKIFVASRAKRNLFDFVSFLSENNELLLRAGRCFLRLIEASVLLAHILDLTRR